MNSAATLVEDRQATPPAAHPEPLAARSPAGTSDIVLRVDGLGITLVSTGRRLLEGCSFILHAGERLTLVGESGAGKSLLAQAIMATLPGVMRVHGRVQITGRDTDGQRHRTRPLWGREIVMLPQEPWTALDPLMRLRTQVAEAGRFAAGLAWTQAHARADAHLKALGLAHAGWQWLHQVSGGMAQRVGLACATQQATRVLVADEPTKGLDADACEQVALLLAAAQREGQALLTITHDLELARRLGGRVAVMRQGSIVEQGDAQEVLVHPAHAYTQALVAAQPRHWPQRAAPAATEDAEPLLRAEALGVRLGGRTVLRDASLQIGAGASVAVVGPSGCGKTTLGNVLVGLQAPSSGRLWRRPGLPAWRFQKLYQDPVASFSAYQSIGQGLTHLQQLHRVEGTQVAPWLERLHLDAGLLARRPHEVSGGELQRLALLRAMLLQPVFVFADEPTSRLDALTQRDTMEALCAAVAQTGCAMLLVSHDPHLAARCTQRQWGLREGHLHEGRLAEAPLR